MIAGRRQNMMDRFRLAPRLIEEISVHAQECYPEEACGIVAGACLDVGTALYRGRNLSPEPRVAFEVDPGTLARQLDLEDAGLAITAIYHSHPAGPATPSPIDISRMSEAYPDSAILICSLTDVESPVLRAFRVIRGQAREIGLVQDSS
jgi:[CysO sulfur-carrier protein]-S-L-cysteine hydrolase